MSAQDIINKYISFYIDKDHKRIANAPLVPINDPTTLFTSSGMQALVPYLLGEKHPSGTRLVNVQDCLRVQDIEEIGDNRHTTFFRMLGNWSLGNYFKKEQLNWIFTFLTDSKTGLGLDPNRLYVTVFKGDNEIPADIESIEIWKEIFAEKGIKAELNKKIFQYGVGKNWWSRSGIPSNMPEGEPGGPDSEVFYDFEDESIHKNSEFSKEKCHVNCDCGRYIEIANSVFMQYIKKDDKFEELPKKNVDFGGGLERFILATEHIRDIFQTSLFKSIIEEINNSIINEKYNSSSQINRSYRIIADHLVSAVMISASGIEPSNKERGYVLRRLIRRAATQKYLHSENTTFESVIDEVIEVYSKTNSDLIDKKSEIKKIILEEDKKFSQALNRGVNKWKSYANEKTNDKNKLPKLNTDQYFDLYQSFGLPFEVIKELGDENLKEKEFNALVKKHQTSSRTASAGMFRGGLADHSTKTIMGHTATHLLHKALRDMLGTQVHQSGSNITSERIRFDYNYDKRLSDEQIAELDKIVNEKIHEELPVHFELIDTEKAHKMGAIGLFMDTYGKQSKIYFIGDTSENYKNAYSIEFCGGPHVDNTKELKNFKIIKQESLGKNQKRIYCEVNY